MKGVHNILPEDHRYPFTKIYLGVEEVGLITGENRVHGRSIFIKSCIVGEEFYTQILQITTHLNQNPHRPYIIKLPTLPLTRENIEYMQSVWDPNWRGVVVGVNGIKRLIITEIMGKVVFKNTFVGAVKWVLKG